jgi:hypothetical protein
MFGVMDVRRENTDSLESLESENSREKVRECADDADQVPVSVLIFLCWFGCVRERLVIEQVVVRGQEISEDTLLLHSSLDNPFPLY